MDKLIIAGWAFTGSLWALEVYLLTGAGYALIYIGVAAIVIVGNIVAAIAERKS